MGFSNVPTPASALPPTGSVLAYFGVIAPDGWLIADGSTFDPVAFPDLAGVLGGNVLPDLRSRFLKGVGAEALGQEGGRVSHTHDTHPTANVGILGVITAAVADGNHNTVDHQPPFVACNWIIKT